MENNINNKICEVISEALQKPLEQVTSDKKLFVDFSIESVEALELEFAIEEAFDIKIGPQDLWKLPSYLINNNLLENGFFNNEALNLIHKSFPLLDDNVIQAIKTANDIYKNIRVVDIVSFVNQQKSCI